MQLDPKLIALHKHWCTADAVKQFVSSKLPENQNAGLPDWGIEIGNTASRFYRLTVWYALLFVVVEGYISLKLTHPKVDQVLLNTEYVDYLRLFRNSTFHYQKDPISEKMMKFLDAEQSEEWIRNLNNSFHQFFLDSLPIKEYIANFKNNP